MENNAKDKKGHLQNFTFPFWNSTEAYSHSKCVFIPSPITANHQLAMEFMQDHTSQTSEV